MIEYGKNQNGMSEYEAYFSYVWLRYRDRASPAYVPWVLRMPHLCNSRNSTMTSQVIVSCAYVPSSSFIPTIHTFR